MMLCDSFIMRVCVSLLVRMMNNKLDGLVTYYQKLSWLSSQRQNDTIADGGDMMRKITPIENSRRHAEFCPLDTTLSVLSGKWKSIIICRLMTSPRRFSALQKAMPDCTNRMLAMQLKELVADQIVVQRLEKHAVYELTAIGASLVPVVQAMDRWGKDYLETIQLSQPKPVGQ